MDRPDDSKPLLAPNGYATEPQRWYILAVFSFFSFNQCLLWFTFSSVKADKVCAYYDNNATAATLNDDNDSLCDTGIVNNNTLALLLNW